MESEPKIDLKETLRKSVWALSVFSLLALILTRELEIFSVISILTLAPLFYYFDSRNRLARMRWLENTLVLLDFAIAASRFFLLKDSFLLIVADFLAFFLLLKFGFKKDRGDYLQMIYLSFFVLLSCSTLSLDFTFLLSFIFYALIASWTLSIHNLSLSSEETLIVFDEAVSGKEVLRRIRQNSWLTLGFALFFAFVIFVFFPRLSVAVFQGAFLGPVHESGFTEKVNLETSGKIFKDPKVVMRVQIDRSSGKNWQGFLYLRGQALSVFNGKTWSAGSRKETQFSHDSFKSRVLKMGRVTSNRFQVLAPEDHKILKSLAGMKLTESSYIKQKIFLESMDTSLLFAAPWVESLSAKVPRILVYHDGTISRPAEFKGRIAYEAASLIERPPMGSMQYGKGSENLQLPYSTASDWREIQRNLAVSEGSEKIAELGRKMYSRRDKPYAKAKRVEKYLRENYKYTLELKGSEKENPLEDFLFASKEGHCEYFASAMVMILRAEGIPARIATGFLMDEKNVSGEYYVVRAQDAHAWVEAYLGGFWTQFDPTPRARRFEAEEITFWQRIGQGVDYLNFLWIYHVLGYDQEYQEKVARRVEIKSSEISMKLDLTLGNFRRKIRIPWKKLLLLPALAALGAIWAAKRHCQGHRTGGKAVKIRGKFYKEMLEVLARRGFLREDGETPHEFALRIDKDLKESAVAVKDLTDKFCAIRYGDRFLAPNQEFQINQSIKNLKTSLKYL